MMQINLTGFLGGSKARLFISELWSFLTSGQSSPDGIAAELVEMKKLEMIQRQVDLSHGNFGKTSVTFEARSRSTTRDS